MYELRLSQQATSMVKKMYGLEETHQVENFPHRRDVHVLHQEGNWIVTTAGSDETYFGSLEDAEQYGRQIACREHSKFFVHSEDGTIIDKDCYENQQLESIA